MTIIPAVELKDYYTSCGVEDYYTSCGVKDYYTSYGVKWLLYQLWGKRTIIPAVR